MDNPDAPHTDVVTVVLLRALLASGDIDEAHALTFSFSDLITRWIALHDRFAAKKYKLTTAQRKKVAAWLRVGLVDILISKLEALRPNTESQPAPVGSVINDCVGTEWWSLLGILHSLIKVACINSEEPTIAATTSDPSVVGSMAGRLITVFLDFKHFAHPPESKNVFHFVESSCLQSLEIVNDLLLYCMASTTVPRQFHLSLQVYELAIRFAIISQRHLATLARSSGGYFSLGVVLQNVTESSSLLNIAVQAVRRISQNDQDPSEQDTAQVSRITGLAPMTLIGDALCLADVCRGHLQMDGYYTATTIIAADPSRAMVSAAHRHHYLRRSLAFLKEYQFTTRDVSHPRSEFMTLTFFCDTWTVCLNTPPLHDHRIIFLSESVNGGLLFMLERASYFPCDLDGRLEKVVGAALASLVTIPVYLFTEVRPIREKVFSQSEVIARRMEQNPNIQTSIRKLWSNFVHSEARVLRRNLLEGPFCSNYGCETMEVAGQQCAGCKTRFYCSKECQTSDWRRFHKIQCTRPARMNPGSAGTS